MVDAGKSSEPVVPTQTTSLTTPQDAEVPESASSSVTKSPFNFKTPATLKKLDAFISHLNRLLHTRDGHDSLLLFLAYATQLLAAILETPGPASLQIWAQKLLILVPKALTSRLLSLLPTSKISSLLLAAPGVKLRLAERLRALVDMLDDWHTMSRLWGLITMWMLAKELIMTSSTEKKKNYDQEERRVKRVEKTIAATQILSLIGFFVFENTAWLSRRRVLAWSEKAQPKLMLWCVRSWGVYVFAEVGRLLFERARKKKDKTSDENSEERSEWNKKFVQALAWAPLTVHWTRPDGLLPETVAAFLAAYAEFISVQGLWKETVEVI
ncbi:hypothetical protein FALBO_3548 [Fusarium albosuccineum]|uniref:Peroxin 11C n=1 Tax=Fusarium albosuccineum TaxID=1237068 RepID=A0A8H4LIT9_9HYPO|nr:hypothetical protein FALBO_3548 [Fusarium albosuccineum]